MTAAPPAYFLLAIQEIAAQPASDYAMKIESRGLPTEVVLTMVRHWLRMAEDQYHAVFTDKG